MNKIIFSLKKYIPASIRKLILSSFNFKEYRNYSNAMANPFINEPDFVNYDKSPLRVGIVFSKSHYHKFWIAACRDLKISYRIIYLGRTDWMDQIEYSDCEVFLLWPDISDDLTKAMQDERMRIMVEDMHKIVFPSLKEIWLYENKRVQHYWLKANGFKTPETHVFYETEEALKFLDSANYPLVFKSNFGASASGVYIVKEKKEALLKAKSFLSRGYMLKGNKSSARQKGSLYIQEYIANAKEWRMVRIGDSYFGHGKDMTGQFHSGSGKANWDMPPKKAFDLLMEITGRGNFTSMDVDIFEAPDGSLYVNELQTVFGNSIAKEQMKIDGVPGRYVFGANGEFVFEPGSFCENHLCNLRLEYVIKCLES